MVSLMVLLCVKITVLYDLAGRQAAVNVDRDHLANVTRWNDHRVLASSVHVAASTSTTTAETDTLSTRVNVAMNASYQSSKSGVESAVVNEILTIAAAGRSRNVAASRPTHDVMKLNVTVDRNVNTHPAAVVDIRLTVISTFVLHYPHVFHML